ncbi:uncharacterized protein LOC117344516 [Pecten maximus]|uniref:uncharacterized protein LOC117344516 n=1 Tax=Pecten maximus TaxID=6579 RepID=UPI001458F874|nr:uncharacterized protein LOC117344516 [Pecten maximus]
MDTDTTSIRLFIQLVIIYCNVYHTTSDQTVCSSYLVSGIYGVEDAALTASSTFTSNGDHRPEYARLYHDGLSKHSLSWSSASVNDQQYIQVKFPRETVVDTILIQGRGDLDQWVSTYYILYSMDGTTWTTVTSQNQEPKLFNGNSDMNSVVKVDLLPKVTAMYLRINPRSWNKHISLRFDVSGCYKARKKRYQSTFFRLQTPPSAALQYYLMNESMSTTFPACSAMCHTESSCFSFTFDVNQKLCRGYKTVIFGKHGSFTNEAVHYFVQNVANPSLGFQQLPASIFKYKINEVIQDQNEAFHLCISYQSRLIRIASKSKMETLQNIIAGNTILRKHHNQLFVSGMYVAPQWKYNDGSEVINSVLWSPGNPNVTQGNCVILTLAGLASMDCAEKLFSICESF